MGLREINFIRSPSISVAFETLTPGNYTVVVRGKNESSGIALVEIYNVKQ